MGIKQNHGVEHLAFDNNRDLIIDTEEHLCSVLRIGRCRQLVTLSMIGDQHQ